MQLLLHISSQVKSSQSHKQLWWGLFQWRGRGGVLFDPLHISCDFCQGTLAKTCSVQCVFDWSRCLLVVVCGHEGPVWVRTYVQCQMVVIWSRWHFPHLAAHWLTATARPPWISNWINPTQDAFNIEHSLHIFDVQNLHIVFDTHWIPNLVTPIQDNAQLWAQFWAQIFWVQICTHACKTFW